MRTFGTLRLVKVKDSRNGKRANHKEWVIEHAEPHVCIKLKSIFTKIAQFAVCPFSFTDTPENCHDLLWFMERYPLSISGPHLNHLKYGRKKFLDNVNNLEEILLPDYKPVLAELKPGRTARDYQLRGRDVWLKTKRLLLVDDMGLGKTLTSTLGMLDPNLRPAAIVCQSHLPDQWEEQINLFTNLRVHQIKGTRPYDLPEADAYIFKYSCLAGWVDVFNERIFKSVIFDEIQMLRRVESNRYQAAKVLSKQVNYAIGLSGTPIYNYGDEIYAIMNLLKEGCLGDYRSFSREWCNYGKEVQDPKALGAYLRENFLYLRRTRDEVGRELPIVNKIVHTVGYDSKEVKKSEEIARSLAIRVMEASSFVERGKAARDLDWRLRELTGISKARDVAAYVKIFLDNGEPVVLAGWHREVYSIWLEELAEYNPVMYTGSESQEQKNEAVRKFTNGDSKLFIISLRSGVGLDGLQKICKVVIFGELDWSPPVHDQVITRVDRDGQPEQVTAIFLVSDFGSDPVIIDVLGVKASQSHGIINPFSNMPEKFSDESRIKLLAKRFLDSLKST